MKKFLLILVLSGYIFNASSQCLDRPHPYAIKDVSAKCSVLDTPYINVYKTTCT